LYHPHSHRPIYGFVSLIPVGWQIQSDESAVRISFETTPEVAAIKYFCSTEGVVTDSC